MTTAKKAPLSKNTHYKLDAAQRRSKLAASNMALEFEVPASEGRIQVVLSGKAILPEQQESLFGPSAIDIPEFTQAQKKIG